MHSSFLGHAVLRWPSFFSRAFGWGASRGAMGTLRPMPRSRLTAVAVLWALNVAALALFPRGCAPPSWAGSCAWKPLIILFFFKNSPLRNHVLLLLPAVRRYQFNMLYRLCCLLRRTYIKSAAATAAIAPHTSLEHHTLLHTATSSKSSKSSSSSGSSSSSSTSLEHHTYVVHLALCDFCCTPCTEHVTHSIPSVLTPYRERTVKSANRTNVVSYIMIKNENTLVQLWDRRFCRNSSLQAVCDTPIARITGCVSSLRI